VLGRILFIDPLRLVGAHVFINLDEALFFLHNGQQFGGVGRDGEHGLGAVGTL